MYSAARYDSDWPDVTNATKSSSFIPNNVKHEVVQPEDYQYGQDDQASRSNTPSCPSMTHSSSRSASSSIIACGQGVCAGQYCNCQDVSDTESCRIQQYGVESPRILPATALPGKKIDGLNPTSLYTLKRAGFSLPINKRPSSLKASFPVENDSIECDKFIDEVSVPKPGDPDDESPISASMTHVVPSSGSPHNQLVGPREARLDEDSECEYCDEDEDDEDDDDESDEDDWSGQDDDLEARVLEALGNDLPLAAHLIPLLHKVLYSVFSRNITRKVGPWRHGVTKYGTETETTSSGKTTSSNAPTSSSTNDQKKRHRNFGSESRDREDEDGDDDEEDEDERSRDPKRPKDDARVAQYPRLACPFNKLDPKKYGIQHEGVETGKKADYRTCTGPGFKSIQRLKEHLKRKHYPVQCERCYRIFEGPDRAARALELENHRQLLDPCRRNSSSLKEGISDAQWASLDKKKSKKNQSSSNVEKWNDIWGILFPDSALPTTPWYVERVNDRPPPTPSEGSNEFIGLLCAILTHQINQEHIQLEQEMLNRVLNAARKAFQAWSTTCRWQASSSSGNSSSARSLPQSTSLLGGSYQQIPMPSIGGRQRSMTSVSTAIRSQAYSADLSVSPTGSSLMHSRRHRSENIVPGTLSRYMDAQQEPHIGFDNSMIQQRFPTGPPAPPEFAVGLAQNMEHFVESTFDGTNMGNTEDPWMNYDGSGAGFDNRGQVPNINGASFANPNGSIDPNQTLLNSPESPLQGMNGMHGGWTHFHAPGRSHYTGSQS